MSIQDSTPDDQISTLNSFESNSKRNSPNSISSLDISLRCKLIKSYGYHDFICYDK